MRDGSVADEMRYIEAIERRFDTHVRWVPTPSALDVDGCVRSVLEAESPLGLWPTLNAGLHSELGVSGSRSLLSGLWGDEVAFSQGVSGRHGAAPALRVESPPPDGVPEVVCGDSSAGRTITSGLVHDIVYAHTPDLLYRERGLSGCPTARDRRPCSPTSSGLGPRRGSRLPARHRQWTSYHTQAVLGVTSDWTAMTRTEIQSKLAHRHGAEASFPFLDRDLVGFIASNNGELMSWQGSAQGRLCARLRPPTFPP